MPRYFGSAVIGRPLVVTTDGGGERSFIFEPVEPMGGSWLGVLAVDDDATANVLAGAQGAWEIAAEAYERLKKKRAMGATARGFAPSQTPQLKPQPLVANANPAGLPSSSGFDAVKPVTPAKAPLANISLLVTDKFPPAEPLLERNNVRRRKAA